MIKIKKCLLVIIMILFLNGCSIKSEYNMMINSDKSIDISVIEAFDNEFIDGIMSMDDGFENEEKDEKKKEYTDSERWNFIENELEFSEDSINPVDYGFQKIKYNKDNYKGYKYTKTISNIDNVTGNNANFSFDKYYDISNMVVFTKNGDVYKAKLVLETDEELNDQESIYDFDFDYKFTVSLPNKPISHNADEISNDGKTLTWNLLEVGSKNIEFDFKISTGLLSSTTIWTLIIIVLVILFILSLNANRSLKEEANKSLDEKIKSHVYDNNNNAHMHDKISNVSSQNIDNIGVPIIGNNRQNMDYSSGINNGNSLQNFTSSSNFTNYSSNINNNSQVINNGNSSNEIQNNNSPTTLNNINNQQTFNNTTILGKVEHILPNNLNSQTINNNNSQNSINSLNNNSNK